MIVFLLYNCSDQFQISLSDSEAGGSFLILMCLFDKHILVSTGPDTVLAVVTAILLTSTSF